MSSQSESEKQTERFDGKIKNLPESVKQVLQQAWNEGIHWNGALDLSQKDITQDMVGDLIDCLDLFGDRLKELNLYFNDLGTDGGIELIKWMKDKKSKINNINLERTNVGGGIMHSLGELIQENPNVHSVKIGYNVTDLGFKVLMPFLNGNKSLQFLGLQGNKKITDKSINTLETLIQMKPNLIVDFEETSISQISLSIAAHFALNKIKGQWSVLDLNRDYVTDDFIIQVCQTLDQYGATNLKEVYFNGKITSNEVSMILNALNACKANVKKLHIKYIQLSKECIEILGRYMQSSNSVEDLSIIYGALGDEHVELFARSIQTLKYLNLSSNKITSKGVSFLCESLKEHNVSLLSLNLNENNEIGDDYLEQLVELMKAINSLKYINLSHTNLTDGGVSILNECLQSKAILLNLDVSGNKQITDKSANILKNLAINLRVKEIKLRDTSISSKNQNEIYQSLDLPIYKVADLIKNIYQVDGGAQLNRAKIMTAGDGGAGKTSTIRSLTGQKFVKEHISTIGASTKDECKVQLNDVNQSWIIKSSEDGKKSLAVKHQARSVIKNRNKYIEGKEKQRTIGVERETKQINQAVLSSKKPFYTSIMSSISSIRQQFTGTKNIWKRENLKIKNVGENDIAEIGQNELLIIDKGERVTDHLYDDDLENEITISIWDLGGQKVFYALHHLFLTDYSVYLVVFNMTHLVSNDPDEKDKALDNILFWLRSIQMHASKAKIFLIGSYLDSVSDKAQHQQINDLLLHLFDGKHINKDSFVRNINQGLFFWPLDNTKGSESYEIRELRSRIMDAVMEQDYLKEVIPLKWTNTFDAMLAINKKHISLDDFHKIAKIYGMKKEEDIMRMLERFHELGMLLYFGNEHSDLKYIIVLDPQWLVDTITKVIRQFDLHEFDNQVKDYINVKLSKEFARLQNESIAHVNLINYLWQDEDKNSKTDFTVRKYLLSLMDQMNLATPWKFYENGLLSDTAKNSASVSSRDIQHDLDVLRATETTEYLIPSNLRLFPSGKTRENELEINNHIQYPTFGKNANATNTLYSPNCFIVDFSESFLPIGFFDRLLCLLVGYSCLCFKNNMTPLLADGKAMLSLDRNQFRIDEDLSTSRLIFILERRCNKSFVLKTVESLVKQLAMDMMSSLMQQYNKDRRLPYRILIVIWDDQQSNFHEVDIQEATEALITNKVYMYATDKKTQIRISSVDIWLTSRRSSILKQNSIKMENLAFLSHVKSEAGDFALLFKYVGESYLNNIYKGYSGNLMYLDSDNLYDLRNLLNDVRRTKVMVVFLTNSYLTRPWCLAELYTAIQHKIPILLVNIVGKGYDFRQGVKFIEKLTFPKLDKIYPGASKILKDLKINIKNLKDVLLPELKNVIAKPLHTDMNSKLTRLQIEDFIEEIIEKIQ